MENKQLVSGGNQEEGESGAKPKIIVTGANGQLGKELRVASAGFPQFAFIFLSKEELPIHDFQRTRGLFEAARPVFCINCAAYTAVDSAETEKEQAFLVNGESVGTLASVCKLFHTRLIHISTDYVFDGNSSIPLKEDDPTGPINVYGASKLLGEQLALQNNQETIVIRTSWVYSVFGNNFVKTMIRLMREKESINVINDQLGSPTHAADLAALILRITGSGKFIPGVYHYSNEGKISWWDFAVAIKELTGSHCQVNPIPASQYPTPARRPHYSLLDKSKIKNTWSIEIPDWKESLAVCLRNMEK
jgi:dTDP-4-dehydrorhamnose reductase